MKQINLDSGCRVSVYDKIQQVHGYELGNSVPVISIYSHGIRTRRSLPVDFAQAAALVELYGRCIEEYRLMIAEELYSRETLE